MIEGEIVHVSGGLNRQHVTAAAVATAVSVVMHVALLLLLPGVRFNVPVVPEDYRRQVRPRVMRLTDVVTETAAEAAAGEAWRTASAMEGAAPVTLEGVVRELAVAPDEVAVEPPPVTEETMAGEDGSVMEPQTRPERDVWQPRQEILAVDEEMAASGIHDHLDRPFIPRVERVGKAPDVVVSVDRRKARTVGASAEPGAEALGRTVRADVSAVAGRAGPGTGAGERGGLVIGEAPAKAGTGLFSETPSEITSLKHIENLLRARITTYSAPRDLRHAYFRVEIERAGAEVLPVIAKDLVFVQDCSASMSEQRLYFCRQALVQCLSELGPEDRFNVVGFRDTAEFCFPDWTANTPAARQEAQEFIGGLTAGGNTDIYRSIKELMKLKQTPGRPAVAVMITDGLPTAGITDSSDIIGEFTKLNTGRVSVFSMGSMRKANTYLLDLLSYCNRGDASLVRSGRWGIPNETRKLVRGLKRPVLSEVGFQFAGGEDVEVYPVLTSNLYLDKALVLYGRYRRGMDRAVFQVVGRAADVKCDMLFTLALEGQSGPRQKGIREMWAKQKIYHLIGQYARQPSAETLAEIRQTARAYGVRVPHRGRF